MKKVLFVINTLGCAGAEKALLELLKRFSPEQYEVSLYVLLGQGELIHEIPEYVRVLNKDYSDTSVLSEEGKKILRQRVAGRLFKRGALIKNLPGMLRYLAGRQGGQKAGPDKLLWRVMSDSAWYPQEHYDLAVAYLEGGATYYVHDHVKADKKMTFLHVDYIEAGYTRQLDQNCYIDFDKIFTVSSEVSQSFLSVYPECREKTEVFHNLIDQEEIKRKSMLSGGFADRYDGFRILTVGRLTAQKAYETAIDAMKIVKDAGIRARWYVLGEGELRSSLQAQIDQLGLHDDFILLGAVSNPYPYYRQCDLYVHATRFEGKSIAIQEAQTLGCALLVSDCSGNREQVTEGVDGSMCELTAEAVAREIIILLKDDEKRRQYGKNAAARQIDNAVDIRKIFEL